MILFLSYFRYDYGEEDGMLWRKMVCIN